MIPCIEIAELFLAGSSDRVCYSAAARPDLGTDDPVEDGATSVRPRRGPLQESPVDAARSHGGLEIDAASSARAWTSLTRAMTPSTMYMLQRPPASLRIRSPPLRPQNPKLTLLQITAPVGRRATRSHSQRSTKQHEGPLTARPTRSFGANRIPAQRNMTFEDMPGRRSSRRRR